MLHPHEHDHTRQKTRKALLYSLLFTGFFMLVEFVGGWVSNSLALMSDALHMLTDFGALFLSLFAFWLSQKPSTPQMSYGFRRAEIVGALINALGVWLLSGVLILEAFQRLNQPQLVETTTVFVVGALGLLVNLASVFFLRGAKDHNLGVKGAYIHVMSDLIGSIGVLVSAYVIRETGWYLVDPLVTFLIAALILRSSWKLLRESVGVLMESAPAGLNPEEIRLELEAIPEVSQVHHLHVWTVASGKPALSVHLVSEGEQTLQKAHDLLLKKYRIQHSTIQVEHPAHYQADDQEACADC